MQMQLTLSNEPRVLIVGSGAREHAIAWCLARSSHHPKLFSAPGNPGIQAVAETVDILQNDIDGLVQFALEHAIDFVVAGPEIPLSLGLADRCRDVGIPVFGPSQAAARLESSKAFAKELMRRASIPTAEYEVFTNADSAKDYVFDHGAPIVIKADGLAAGKGVVVANTTQEASEAIDDMLVAGRFGASGGRVVIESLLHGEEVSLMYFVDAQCVKAMVPARDFKRIHDGGQGPNTGGMGAFAPVTDFQRDGLEQVVTDRIVQPLLDHLKADGIVYRGVLYVGLMVNAEGPFVVEFNCRFGDPETQVVLPLLDTDLLEVMWAVAHDQLQQTDVVWKADQAVCVVLAAAGYPEHPRLGDSITVNGVPSGLIFHAGTAARGETLVTSGGRVLSAVGTGPTRVTARTIAYETAQTVYFDGKHMRSDIASD